MARYYFRRVASLKVATIALETPLTSLERQAKTEYKARAYFSDEKKAPGAYRKLIVPVNEKD